MKQILLIAVLACLMAEGHAQENSHGSSTSPQQVERLSPSQQRELAETLRDYTSAARALEEARQEQVLHRFDLTAEERSELEQLYNAYRKALNESVPPLSDIPNTREMGNTELLRYLKEKLAAISAAARVKRDYVDKFASVLSAEQIRELYNTEGQLATQLKAAAASAGFDLLSGADGDSDRINETEANSTAAIPQLPVKGNCVLKSAHLPLRRSKKITGSGRYITQNLGRVDHYTGIAANAFVSVTVSRTAREMTLTADDNVMDYITVTKDNGRIGFRVNASNMQNIRIRAVIPFSPRLRELSASGYGSIVCEEPLRSDRDIHISSSGGATIEADAAGTADITLEVTGYAAYAGTLSGRSATATINGGAKAKGNLAVTESVSFSLSGYGEYKGDIKARSLELGITGGARMEGSIHTQTMETTISGYAKMTGKIETGTLDVQLTGGASLHAALSGRRLSATLSGYAKAVLKPLLKNPIPLDNAELFVSAGSDFNAPTLPLRTCRINATGYASAHLYCTGTLRTSITSGAKITYDGPCEVYNETSNVRHR